MTATLTAPAWADMPTRPETLAASLRQLVNAAGPLACGMAVALEAVQRAQIAEEEGETPGLDATQRGHLIALCAVSAQMLGAAATEACDDLLRLGC
ncbi:hypothetical protein [Hydrogenophaga electricum]|uniref:Uncharacterized protein n=1 Tax=Hydrogenophaga electricum TaxID=1230953 RepID=A0ABQ6C1J2_9BURK|nr:hypothetical protein [Hydrogenophaga electricum]GLS13579.1 hypothetical protein GCM10007935_10090 [Hydrogenophaga electricum]